MDKIKERDRIEAELEELLDVLKSHNVDMTTPLVVDGYPRADIDVPTVRSVRQQIIRLRNDLKQVMTEIESELHKYFQKPQQNGTVKTTHVAVGSPVPFAVVNRVAEGSPANEAGFQINDLILSFGEARQVSHCRAQIIAQTPIAVTILRDGVTGGIGLTLTPNGDGSIGLGMAPL